MLDEAADVLAPDQRDVFPKLSAVDVQQAATVFTFLGRHLGENVGAAGIVGAQTFGDVQVDTAVLFLIGDRQSEDLAFGQI